MRTLKPAQLDEIKNRIETKSKAIENLRLNKNEEGFALFTDVKSNISIALDPHHVKVVRAFAIKELKEALLKDKKEYKKVLAQKSHYGEK